MLSVKLTPMTIAYLSGNHFTLEGAEALCEYLEEFEDLEPMTIGDLCICFTEIPAEWRDCEEEENIIAELDNGNILVSR